MAEVNADRFWPKIDRSGGPSACWPWIGARNRRGYGRISVGGKNQLAHRVAYSLVVGTPEGTMILHSCDNPPCCNPAHLRSGTAGDNTDDYRTRILGKTGPPEQFKFCSTKRERALLDEVARRLTRQWRTTNPVARAANRSDVLRIGLYLAARQVGIPQPMDWRASAEETKP